MKTRSKEIDPTRDADLRLDRRDLMKLGAGAVGMAALAAAPKAAGGQARGGQDAPPAPGSMRKPGEIAPFTMAGYKNDYGRLNGNGPMDDTTAKIVKWVHGFKETDVTPAAKKQFDRTMIDSLAALVAGFEEEAPRLSAKVASMARSTNSEKCTVLGYGIETTPELATFVNGALLREVDFNDTEHGVHYSVLIPAALSMGEALHRSGSEVMAAIVVGYEISATPAGHESVIAAMVAGKLMRLDEDRLANALTMALTPHIALNKGVGAMSMWKGLRSTEAVKCGVWAALLAREGITGPPQPFEGRGGYWASQKGGRGMLPNGMGRDFTLPLESGALQMEENWFKRRPAEASSQGILYLMPEIRAWVGNPGDISWLHIDTSYGNWEEICDAPKWDPRNRQTADHSLPYITARALLDGDVYLDSFNEEKYNEPAARALLAKTSVAGVNGWVGLGAARITITKKSGESKWWDTYEGKRIVTDADYPPLTTEELKAKFDRSCNFRKVAPAQRDQAYKVWGNISELKDFGDAMKVMAKFGQPKPL